MGERAIFGSQGVCRLGNSYGNSNTLPFVKQFFSGGPYSVRAFPIRSLGPGTLPLQMIVPPVSLTNPETLV
ncbi:BamA/TamA family outer membrane protein [Winogradskyella maritima]|nr:BamA/TamA family outer membrane protein [Winogradskyella maritima]